MPWAVWQPWLPMGSVIVGRRAGEPACLGSRWPLDIILPDAVVGCLPHYFCPTARIVLHILGKRDGVKLSSVFIAPLHYPVDRGRRKDLCWVTYLFEDEQLLQESHIPWCEIRSMLLLTFVPVVVLFTYWNWIPLWSYMDGLSEENPQNADKQLPKSTTLR